MNKATTAINTRIKDFELKYGGLRPAARVLQIDPAYLKRLRDSEKTNPSQSILRKLRLRRIVQIVFVDNGGVEATGPR